VGPGAHKTCCSSETVQDRTKVTITDYNRKSHMRFWLAPMPVTLDAPEEPKRPPPRRIKIVLRPALKFCGMIVLVYLAEFCYLHWSLNFQQMTVIAELDLDLVSHDRSLSMSVAALWPYLEYVTSEASSTTGDCDHSRQCGQGLTGPKSACSQRRALCVVYIDRLGMPPFKRLKRTFNGLNSDRHLRLNF